MNDPVQMLIDSGAIPASPFGPSSRYASVSVARYPVAPDESVAYVLRRFVPQARDIPIATRYRVMAGDRLYQVAAHYLGDPELQWRIADANLATDVLTLTATAGALLAIPLPSGTGGR